MITEVRVAPVTLPMGRPFVHSGKARATTASVVVSIGATGYEGFGEGAPREYVTGESLAGAVEALRAFGPERLNRMVDVTDLDAALRALADLDLPAVVGGARPMPAAAAALELAVFDLVCKIHGVPGAEALRRVPWLAETLTERPEPVPVSYVLDMATEPAATVEQLDAEALRSIRHIKLKATKDVGDCVRRADYVREKFAPVATLSVDVNGDWDRATALRAAHALRPLGIAWLEEPVTPRDWSAMRATREEGGIPVMLDESCWGLDDLDMAAQLGAADLVNARVSKCGGIFPTLRLIRRARELGLNAQLGVHVGEVGPLWAAARLLSCSVGRLATVEAGKQDEWFPTPLTEPPYRVNRRKYLAHPLEGAGLGLVPSPALRDACHWTVADG
ncbi:enolase C-terminal domain-like protein [Streptomyces platensis]|uniref:enolase C-terminal domain-like protein n=1 Tax=Streptomyces platensis TaxID=58346 RepID=UPI00386D2DE4|nr:muconate cycloisomerase [Streptomyces platensis]